MFFFQNASDKLWWVFLFFENAFAKSIISSGAEYVICTVKLDEKKFKTCQFDSGKSFWLSISTHSVRTVAAKRHSKRCCTCREECNKYDLNWLLLSVSNWLIIMIGPGDLLLLGSSSSSPRHPHSCCPSFSFLLGGVAKKSKQLQLGCEKHVCRVAYWTPLEMLLVEAKIHWVMCPSNESSQPVYIGCKKLLALLRGGMNESSMSVE